MDDSQIVSLYWERSETAIAETEKKYQRYCYSIAYRILNSDQDAEECVNDTYIKAWQAIPPHRPNRLSTFLGKITRNLALDRYAAHTAEKRGGGQMALALEELQDCIPSPALTESMADDLALKDALNRFLQSLSLDTRTMFLRRYWYLCSIQEIAKNEGISESAVKMRLLRTRKHLRQFLEKEGMDI